MSWLERLSKNTSMKKENTVMKDIDTISNSPEDVSKLQASYQNLKGKVGGIARKLELNTSKNHVELLAAIGIRLNLSNTLSHDFLRIREITEQSVKHDWSTLSQVDLREVAAEADRLGEFLFTSYRQYVAKTEEEKKRLAERKPNKLPMELYTKLGYYMVQVSRLKNSPSLNSSEDFTRIVGVLQRECGLSKECAKQIRFIYRCRLEQYPNDELLQELKTISKDVEKTMKGIVKDLVKKKRKDFRPRKEYDILKDEKARPIFEQGA